MRSLFASLALIGFLAATTFGFAEERIVIDMDKELAKQGGKRGGTSQVLNKVKAFFGGSESGTVKIGDEDWIRNVDVPVVVKVSGAWGDYIAKCTGTFTFQQRKVDDKHYEVQGGMYGGIFELAYKYTDPNRPMSIENFVENPAGNQQSPFVTGDFLMNPNCGFGPLMKPEYTMPARIREVNRLNEACAKALVSLGFQVLNDLPPPVVCIQSQLASAGLAKDLQAGENVEIMAKCILNVGAASGLDARVSNECKGRINNYAKNISSVLGTCSLAGSAIASLKIIDPNPYSFKAIYSYNFRRSDCKTFSVRAFINGAAEGFTVEGVSPRKQECLVVEPVDPKLFLYFNQRVKEDKLEQKIRLVTNHTGAKQIMATHIEQLEDGILQIVPDHWLVPHAHYWLEVQQGENGLESETGERLEQIDVLSLGVGDAPPSGNNAYTLVTSFYASPFSNSASYPNDGEVRGAVYQVTRDHGLVRKRPTVTRIWYEWEVPELDAERYALDFCGTYEVRADDGDNLLYPPTKGFIKNPKLYTRKDKRMGKDSTNLFNWRPDEQVEKLRLRVKPQVYWSGAGNTGTDEEVPYIEEEHSVSVLPHEPAKLKIHYGYLKALDFADGLPSNIEKKWKYHASGARRYLWQVAPIIGSSWHYVGGVTAGTLDVYVPTAAELYFVPLDYQRFIKRSTKAFAREFCEKKPREICLLLIPPRVSNHEDQSNKQDGRGIYVSAKILEVKAETFDSEGRPIQWFLGSGSDMVHEIGHSFGLNHLPLRVGGNDDYIQYVSDGGIFPGIDAIRMDRNGRGGKFKSSKYGNSEHPTHLAPLMFPNVLGEHIQMITDDNYLELWDGIYSAGVGTERFGLNPNGSINPMGSQTYSEIKSQLTRSNLSIIQQSDTLDGLSLDLFLGYDPERGGNRESGVLMDLVFTQDMNSSRLTLATLPQLSEETHIDTYLAADGDGYEIRFIGGGRHIKTQGFRLRNPKPIIADARAANTKADGILSQDVSLFVPLDETKTKLVDLIEVYDAENKLVWAHKIAQLPQRLDGLRYAIDANGMGFISWQAEGAAQLKVRFRADNGASLIIGLGTNSGEFSFNPTDVKLQGFGVFELIFSNGIAEKIFELPVELTSRFIVENIFRSGDAGEYKLSLSFNRPLAKDLPAFELRQAGGRVAVELAHYQLNDQLLFELDGKLAACQIYEIVALAPIKDAGGQGLSGKASWPLNELDAACTETPRNQANLTLTRNGKQQVFKGSVDQVAPTHIVLDFSSFKTTLRFPQGGRGKYQFSRVERGAGRRDLTLIFDETGGNVGGLSINAHELLLTGEFSVQINSQKFEGKFKIPR